MAFISRGAAEVGVIVSRKECEPILVYVEDRSTLDPYKATTLTIDEARILGKMLLDAAEEAAKEQAE